VVILFDCVEVEVRCGGLLVSFVVVYEEWVIWYVV